MYMCKLASYGIVFPIFGTRQMIEIINSKHPIEIFYVLHMPFPLYTPIIQSRISNLVMAHERWLETFEWVECVHVAT